VRQPQRPCTEYARELRGESLPGGVRVSRHVHIRPAHAFCQLIHERLIAYERRTAHDRHVPPGCGSCETVAWTFGDDPRTARLSAAHHPVFRPARAVWVTDRYPPLRALSADVAA